MTREAIHIFYEIQSSYYLVVLGYPWLRKIDPHFWWKTKTWRYPYEENDFEITKPKQFKKKAAYSPYVFAVYILDVIWPEDVKTMCNDSALLTYTLLEEFKDFKDVFDMTKTGILSDHNRFKHAIKTTSDPSFRPLYNLSRSELGVLKDYLENALVKRWIRPLKSSADAPVLFVLKKEEGLRLCVNYRGLNNLMKKNHYPLLLISETLDRLIDAQVFTKINLKDAYYQVRIQEGDEWKMTF
jgi:hypothetical protein